MVIIELENISFLAGNQRPVGLYQPRGRLMQRGGRPEDSQMTVRLGRARSPRQRTRDYIARHRGVTENCRRRCVLHASSTEMRVAEGERVRRRRTPLSIGHDDAVSVPNQFAKVLFNLGHLPLLPGGGGWALPPVIRVF
jgi:hypothetical protein